MRPSALIAAILSLVVAAVVVVSLGRSSGKPVVVQAPTVDAGMPKPSATGPHPKMVLEETVYDFGMLPHDSKGEHEFIVKNEGQAPLQLKIGQKSCQCTSAAADGEDVPPGGSTKIKLEWHIRAKVVRFEHFADLHSNDPDQPKVSLKIRGIVGQKLRTFPPGDWHAGTTTKDTPGSAQGYVLSNMLDEFKIVGTEGSSPTLKATILPLSDSDRLQLISQLRSEMEGPSPADKPAVSDGSNWLKGGYKVVVEVSAAGQAGSYSEPLRFQTDIANDKEVSVNVTGTRPAPFTFIGAKNATVNHKEVALVMSDFEAAVGKTCSVLIYPTGMTEQLVVGEPVCEPSFIKASLSRPSDEGRYVKLTIEVPAGSVPTVRSIGDPATVTFSTNHPLMKELKFKLVFASL